MGVSDTRHAPAALPPGRDPLPTVLEAGWVPGPVLLGEEISQLPGFDPGSVQPVASRYRGTPLQMTPNLKLIFTAWQSG